LAAERLDVTAWDFDYPKQLQSRSLTASRLFCTPRGQGPIVLFVHGGFHGAWCWSPYLQFFAARNVPVAALDLRGHGGLSPPDNFITMDTRDMAADVIEAASALGGPVILAGHSLGALVAAVAAEHVEPAALILLAPAPPGDVPGIHLLPSFPSDKSIAPPPEERVRKWFLQGYGGADITPYLARLCPESPALLNDRYRGRVTARPQWIQGPTLCISAGKDDSALHPAGEDEAVAAFYGAELHVLPEAGHCFMLDDSWEAGAKRVLKWLQRKTLTAAF